MIDGEKNGRNLVIDDKTPVAATLLCEDRYGVISSVIVKNKSRGTKTETVSEQHRAKGISCRRIVNVPRAVRYDAMRHTGAYQIEKSAENMLTVQVVLPWAFAAFPGDRVKINSSPVGAEGDYMVAESRCRGSGAGTETLLTLRVLGER